tara:strand:+ start:822 stop:1007 length:186 start_codon:yes stop_codon:yes gene_type:complete
MLGLIDMNAITKIWGHRSAGKAPAWHATLKKPLIVIYIRVCISNIKSLSEELGSDFNNQTL